MSVSQTQEQTIHGIAVIHFEIGGILLFIDKGNFGSLSTLALTGGSFTFVFDLRAVFGRRFRLASLSLSSLLLMLDMDDADDRRRLLCPFDFIPGSFPLFIAIANPAIKATPIMPPTTAPAIIATFFQGVLVVSLSTIKESKIKNRTKTEIH